MPRTITFNWQPELTWLNWLIHLAQQQGRSLAAIVTQAVISYLQTLLVLAKQRGIITSVTPRIAALQGAGLYLSENLIQQIKPRPEKILDSPKSPDAPNLLGNPDNPLSHRADFRNPSQIPVNLSPLFPKIVATLMKKYDHLCHTES
ncbi:MAG: hypothetical protein B0A82_04760 [Alkalinema sp. CACIAM 70d]|nr:MAG: hypothetical protein B0A82_04760 [Alkalinema sp. CACIAM 70d]